MALITETTVLNGPSVLRTSFTNPIEIDRQGRWNAIRKGRIPAASNGPGPNNSLPYVYTDTGPTSGTTADEMEDRGIAVFRNVPNEPDLVLRLRVCVSGQFGDGTEGLRVESRQNSSSSWGLRKHIYGWPYSNSHWQGHTVTDENGDDLTISAHGGWVDVDIDIPDGHTEVRLVPVYIFASDSNYRHSIALAGYWWTTGFSEESQELESIDDLEEHFTGVIEGNDNGRWREDSGGSSHSGDTGPGSNNISAFVHTETSGGTDATQMSTNGTIQFRTIPTGINRLLRLRLAIMGDFGDGTEGLIIEWRENSTDSWRLLDFIHGWSYSNNYEEDDVIADENGGNWICAEDGGWLDFLIDIPDGEEVEIRLSPHYILSTQSQNYQHDIAIKEFQWTRIGAFWRTGSTYDFTNNFVGNVVSGNGQWWILSGSSGSTESDRTGPGTNNESSFSYTRMVSPTSESDAENNGILVFSSIPDGNDLKLVLRVAIMGEFGSGNEGLLVQSREDSSSTWQDRKLIAGWEYSDSYEEGDEIRDGHENPQTISTIGGWVDAEIIIPNSHSEVRLKPEYIFSGTESHYQHDIGFAQYSWIYNEPIDRTVGNSGLSVYSAPSIEDDTPVLEHVKIDKVQIKHKVGVESTATFNMIGLFSEMTIPQRGDEVLIKDIDESRELFFGIVRDPTSTPLAIGNDGVVEVKVVCVGPESRLRRIISNDDGIDIANKNTAKEQFETLVGLLQDEGFTYITTILGDAIPDDFRFQRINDMLNKIAEDNDAILSVSPNKLVSLIPRDNLVSSNITISKNNLSKLSVTVDSRNHRTHQIVLAGDVSASQNFSGDGSKRSFRISESVGSEDYFASSNLTATQFNPPNIVDLGIRFIEEIDVAEQSGSIQFIRNAGVIPTSTLYIGENSYIGGTWNLTSISGSNVINLDVFSDVDAETTDYALLVQHVDSGDKWIFENPTVSNPSSEFARDSSEDLSYPFTLFEHSRPRAIMKNEDNLWVWGGISYTTETGWRYNGNAYRSSDMERDPTEDISIPLSRYSYRWGGWHVSNVFTYGDRFWVLGWLRNNHPYRYSDSWIFSEYYLSNAELVDEADKQIPQEVLDTLALGDDPDSREHDRVHFTDVDRDNNLLWVSDYTGHIRALDLETNTIRDELEFNSIDLIGEHLYRAYRGLYYDAGYLHHIYKHRIGNRRVAIARVNTSNTDDISQNIVERETIGVYPIFYASFYRHGHGLYIPTNFASSGLSGFAFFRRTPRTFHWTITDQQRSEITSRLAEDATFKIVIVDSNIAGVNPTTHSFDGRAIDVTSVSKITINDEDVGVNTDDSAWTFSKAKQSVLQNPDAEPLSSSDNMRVEYRGTHFAEDATDDDLVIDHIERLSSEGGLSYADIRRAAERLLEQNKEAAQRIKGEFSQKSSVHLNIGEKITLDQDIIDDFNINPDWVQWWLSEVTIRGNAQRIQYSFVAEHEAPNSRFANFWKAVVELASNN